VAVSTKQTNGVNSMIAKMIAFVRDEDGATAIEYGLIAALVSVAAIGALTAMGSSLSTMFNTVSSALSGAAAG
jgi:pilus assembly protein Flp/PilA